MKDYELYEELFSKEERLFLKAGLRPLIDIKTERAQHGTALRVKALFNKLAGFQQKMAKAEKKAGVRKYQ